MNENHRRYRVRFEDGASFDIEAEGYLAAKAKAVLIHGGSEIVLVEVLS